MAGSKFEGDIQNLTQRQLEYINNVIEQEGFKNSKVKFEPVGAAGDNYVANVKRIILEGDGGNLSIIAKIAPSSEQIRNNFQTPVMFLNEIFMYKKILPKFLQLQKQAGVPEDEQIKFPKYYGSLSEAPNEIILLEDLKVAGYNMLDRFIPLTDHVVRGVLKSLAIWHSLSYVLKAKEPDTFNHFRDSLVNYWVHFYELKDNPVIDAFRQVETIAIAILSDYPQYQSIIKDKVNAFMERTVKITKVEDGNRFSVIQHGDAWTNNIMFQFREDGTLKESMLIDYQIARNASPASDILYFIFNCTHHEARNEYFNEWLDHYHSELDKSLANFGIKANYVYPRDQLDADLKRYGKLSVGNTVLTVVMTLLTPEIAIKVKEQMDSSDPSNMLTEDDMDAGTLSAIKKKLVGLVDSFNRFGLL
ncbi:hypothetical protein B5X24_HaOG204482 [Helicoverpa armigera]|uniref:CHK kinase-like domain-containing protein n=1 Tax=Helicoverpa armigera TaxID=29058 RepID=A0A2W1BTI3_HELAM|nr:hypothetical protein B5X24_HaOG204482 [Helicoverpa armigera]